MSKEMYKPHTKSCSIKTCKTETYTYVKRVLCISKETCEKEMEIQSYYALTLLWRCSYRHVYTKTGVRDGGARERREM